MSCCFFFVSFEISAPSYSNSLVRCKFSGFSRHSSVLGNYHFILSWNKGPVILPNGLFDVSGLELVDVFYLSNNARSSASHLVTPLLGADYAVVICSFLRLVRSFLRPALAPWMPRLKLALFHVFFEFSPSAISHS